MVRKVLQESGGPDMIRQLLVGFVITLTILAISLQMYLVYSEINFQNICKDNISESFFTRIAEPGYIECCYNVYVDHLPVKKCEAVKVK